MIKKLSAILSAAMLLFLAACGGSGADDEFRVGSVVRFGGAEWLVLDVRENRALLLSNYILEIRAFHEDGGRGVTWEHSSIREYLNSEFIDAVFNEDEQARIAETFLVNHGNFGNPGGNDTIDRVFLLSIDELTEFMHGDAPQVLHRAKAAYRVGIRTESTEWWLRTPGVDSRNISGAAVDRGGSVSQNFFDSEIGVRPALWLYLE